ncbi:3-phosphoshikimate 1-carboxyvinyltransferase [Winogradskyella aurantia]|uniref:3-phosphoshikimate 1-carboxyvinyltransferase n=1 Tax=Winogradskyella aurantia TaxID=1915063 RepID=A0A265UQ12_9FLAO|nr:3-phosphoshikimate 1-carboxyvinyltransferase [Winogradskyella aurantia]OZV67167.1 3-phosphoshikimate 1-carboxyvinyltransferase [Winogradskyella aurantia]
MDISIQKSKLLNHQHIQITGSKSESNRLLLLQALYPNVSLQNLSNSDDTQLMGKALTSTSDIIDIHHAGTAMRFLTAYFAIQENREVVLTGSSRMRERPIKILVDALRELGADIAYMENEGFPPLRIKGKTLTKSKVSLTANVSSQYISALLLIGSSLPQGLDLSLTGKVTSVPYIHMTLSLLKQLGVQAYFKENRIQIKPKSMPVTSCSFEVESDWSSASYFYSIIALSKVGTEITLSTYKKESLQGDSKLASIYQGFGVETEFKGTTIKIKKTLAQDTRSNIRLDLSDAPDIAQTIAVTAFGLGVACQLNGLHTLKIKETDRLEALQTELQKLGANIAITEESLKLEPSVTINSNVSIATYSDHRMAMAFAPLGLLVPISFQNAYVVTKSYPNFWEDLRSIGFHITSV